MEKLELVSVEIKHEIDDCADTSYLGEYTDTPSDWAIYRRESKYCHDLDLETQQLEYQEYLADCAKCGCNDSDCEDCNPLSFDDWVGENDCSYEYQTRGREYAFFVPYAGGEQQGTEDYQKYGMQDFERMERLNNGDWYYIGVQAVAKIRVNGILQKISSGGLWGIESDSGSDYLEEIDQEQAKELQEQLSTLGFSDVDIFDAFADAGIEMTFRDTDEDATILDDVTTTD